LPEDLADNSKRINAALKTLEREGAIRRETYRDGHRHEKVRYQCGSSTDA
jgi:DNA-binding HxlR family transcriptional regulator